MLMDSFISNGVCRTNLSIISHLQLYQIAAKGKSIFKWLEAPCNYIFMLSRVQTNAFYKCEYNRQPLDPEISFSEAFCGPLIKKLFDNGMRVCIMRFVRIRFCWCVVAFKDKECYHL